MPSVPIQSVAAERVAFGTSGHRGSAFHRTFNEAHILAITQAICLYRQAHSIDGPLFMGMDTHALSEPAFISALEVLAANGVDVMIDQDGGYTPTPVISHAILLYNRRRAASGLADGIVITPSHNPPEDGGFKYNPPTGGPADTSITGWVERAANEILAADLQHGSAAAVRARPTRVEHAPPRLHRPLRGRSRERRRHGSHQTRWCPRGRGSARRRGRALLGQDCGALQDQSGDGERRGRPHVPLHDR